MRFVLVHGSHAGAWCWERLTPELERLGHEALAVDLPGGSGRLHEEASHASWRAALREVIEDGDVLVGHSMGGFAISLAADEVPDKVGRLVYLAAGVPLEGEVMGAGMSEEVAGDWPAVVGLPYEEFIEIVDVPGQGPCARFTRQAAANALFFHDCAPADQDWVWEHLTPLPVGPASEPFHLQRFGAASIPRDYVITAEDRSLSAGMAHEFMRRLGLTTAFSIVSGHSPFISQPAETARILDACARGALDP